MHAQILYSEEVENLAGRVSDAVLDLLADLSTDLKEASLRTAVNELVVTAREQLIRKPVDPAPMVRAILHKDQVWPGWLPDEADELGDASAPAPRDRDKLSAGALVVAEPSISGKALVIVHPRVVQDVPVNNVPVEDIPVEDVPVEDVPVEDIPVDVVPAVGLPLVDSSPVNGFSAPSYWPKVPSISDAFFARDQASDKLAAACGQTVLPNPEPITTP
jgi:hypothetical protein